MKNETDDIDIIIRQKLSIYSFDVPKDEWKRLDKILSFRNFLKFSFSHINIYYIGIFSVLLATASAQFIQNHRLKVEIKKMERIIKNKPDQRPVESLPARHENNKISIEFKTSNQYSPVDNNNVIRNSLPKRTSNIAGDSAKMTTIPVIQNIDSVNNNKSNNIKVVKKTVYIKNNPVIIRDTVIKHKK